MPAAADEEDERGVGIGGALLHHVGADRPQRLGLMQVDDALEPGLRPHALRMIITVAHDHAAPAVREVLQMQPERLARPQPTLKHQQHERAIPQAPKLPEQRLD